MTWQSIKNSLQGFGGSPTTLYIRKIGLPFFDALRLYGAIDVVFRLSGETTIKDEGAHWRVDGKERKFNQNRLEKLIEHVRPSITPKAKGKSPALSNDINIYLRSQNMLLPATVGTSHLGTGTFSGLDSVLQSGMRGISASSYETLQSGNTSDKDCLAKIDLIDGLLAVAGLKRTESVGDIIFLPIYEGTIDFTKIVSPLRAWLGIPTPVCAQALMLLALETSLFSEGYQDCLSAIVYNRKVARGEFAYSGSLSVSNTALSRSGSAKLTSSTVRQFYDVFRSICSKGWNRGKATEFTSDALAMAYWIIHPKIHKHLQSLITSHERLSKHGLWQLFTAQQNVEEIFKMTHGDKYKVDHKECSRFAKAVASGIYHARMKNAKEPKKAWYDEVTMLRSATRAAQFFRRALILIEQGRRENAWVGSPVSEEDFDPKELERYYRQCDTKEFEIFRDLFRMYLIQQSTPRTGSSKDTIEVNVDAESTQSTPETNEVTE